MSNSDEDQRYLAFLIDEGIKWISAQRTLHRPDARAMPDTDKQVLLHFFPDETIENARFREVEMIQNPDFYNALPGGAIPMDFTQMAGITFVDTVLISRSRPVSGNAVSLVFHECVHILQYRDLGINEFVRQYVTGWAMNGFDYFAIPLEKYAYELQARFESAPTTPFSVEREVARQLSE